MRGIEGQVAVRVALKPHHGNGSSASLQAGPIIDTQGFGSAIWYVMFDVDARETQQIYVDFLTITEDEDPNMGSETAIWTCGTDKTIRGEASTLPQYNPPSSEGQQPRIVVMENLDRRQRYMRMNIFTDNAGGNFETDYYAFCFLMDPLESLTTDEQIAESGGEAIYIPGTFS